MGTSQEINKVEAFIVNEEGDTKVDDEVVQIDIWYQWVIKLYPLVSPQKLKRYLDGIRVICL